jgi:DNA-binding beta-propeller fold protein YncE
MLQPRLLFPTLLAVIATSSCAQQAAPPPTTPPDGGLVANGAVALPGVQGRIDHLAFDPKTQRLFVAALGNDSLEVVDVQKRERVRSIGGLHEPQGVVFVPATGQVVVACGGDGRVVAYDAATLQPKGQVEVGDDADNIRLSADGKALWVGYGSGALAELDAASLAVRGQVPLTGHPESFQFEPDSSRAFVNVPSAKGGAAVVFVDLKERKVTATVPLQGAAGNFPMAFDRATRSLYVACRAPAKLLRLDAGDGRQLAAIDCVADADDVFVDAPKTRVMVIGGGGQIDLFVPEAQQLVRAGTTKTPPGARTGMFCSPSLFVAAPKRGEHGAEIFLYTLGT